MDANAAEKYRQAAIAMSIFQGFGVVVFLFLSKVCIGGFGVAFLAIWFRLAYREIGRRKAVAIVGYAIILGGLCIYMAAQVPSGLYTQLEAGAAQQYQYPYAAPGYAPPPAYGPPPVNNAAAFAATALAVPPAAPTAPPAPAAPWNDVLVRGPDGREYAGTVEDRRAGQVLVAFPNGSSAWMPETSVHPKT